MDYFNEIKHLAEKIEINIKARQYQENSEKIKIYWEIGKLIVEAQGGESRAKYGNSLINKWSKKLSQEYGTNYTSRKLREMRQFYLIFQKWPPVGAISWSHYREILQ